jgi:hypothetical protein
MVRLTQLQRKALHRVFLRGAVYANGKSVDSIAQSAGWRFQEEHDIGHCWVHDKYTPRYAYAENIVIDYALATPLTYRQFRKAVIQFDYDAVGIQWCGMWLGIEKDGYTHA